MTQPIITVEEDVLTDESQIHCSGCGRSAILDRLSARQKRERIVEFHENHAECMDKGEA